MLRYLHLSDFHLKKEADSPVAAFNQDIVTRSMLDMIGSLKKPDFVIITGDLAHGGKPEEYEVAEIFCDRLLETAKLDRQRLFLVPGNHDVSRKDVRPKHVKSFYSFDTQEDITETLTDPDIFPILMRKFAGFSAFVEKVKGRRLSDKSEYWFAETLTLTKEGQEHRINLVGLNSCLFAGYDGDDKQKLALGLHQVEPALGKLDRNALSVGFFHHPFSCFHPKDEVCQNLLTRELDLILTGHLHKPSNAFTRNAAGQAVIIGAGASYEARESRNSFNVTEIDPNTGRGKVQFYKYLPEYHVWKKDTDINPAVDDGSFSFTIERLLGDGPDTDSREEDQPDGVTPEKTAEKKGDVINISAGRDVVFTKDKGKVYQAKNCGILGDNASVEGGIHIGNKFNISAKKIQGLTQVNGNIENLTQNFGNVQKRGIRAGHIHAENVVDGAQIVGDDPQNPSELIQVVKDIGGGVSANDIRAKNLVSGLQYIKHPDCPTSEQFHREFDQFGSELREVIEAGEIPDQGDAEDIRDALLKLNKEISASGIPGSRGVIRLREISMILTRNAEACQKPGNPNARIIQLAHYGASLWLAAQNIRRK
ncbi:metallophosphoesterase [Desulfobacterales bacterium HSG2]|nr:metallophosphoesterase [Desulfobacterales bacterium HSG2]